VKILPVRKGIRLMGYDYSRNGLYFITLCVKDKHEMLGTLKNQQFGFSEYGIIVKQEIENISTIRKECTVDKYVIMPNHIHMIVRIVGDDGNRPELSNGNRPELSNGNRPELSNDRRSIPLNEQRADCHPPLRKSIPNMVQGFKGAVTRRIGFSIWQRSFHDRIIRDEAEYRRIWQYVESNPKRWAEDEYNC